MSTCFLGSLAPNLCFRGTTPRSSPLAALDGNEQLLRAAGGLLRFLEQNATLLGDLQGRWQGPCVQDSSQQRLKKKKCSEGECMLHIVAPCLIWPFGCLEDIRIFSPDDAVFVDTQTMIALQIFQDPRASRSTRWRSVELPRFTMFTIPIVFLLFRAQHLWISLVHTTHVPKLDLEVFGYWINWIAPLALCCYLIWSRSKPLRSKSKLCLVRYRYGLTVGYVHWCANRICSTLVSF